MQRNLEWLLSDADGGRPLTRSARAMMERHFSTDFGEVRVHMDGGATASLRVLGAIAYTVGSDIVLAPGHYGVATPARRSLLAHELAHVVQNRRRGAARNGAIAIEPADSPAEREADRAAARLLAGLPAGPVVAANRGIACTRASDAIGTLIGYTDNAYLNDAEERTVLNLLRSDANFSQTIIDLDKAGYLDNLFDRIGGSDRRELIEVLGGKLPNATADTKLSREIRKREVDYGKSSGMPLDGLWQALYNISRNLQGNIKAHNLVFRAPAFSASAHSGGIGRTSSSPFSGSGATGVNPSTMSVGVGDSYKLWKGKKSYPNTWKKYSNPLGGLGAYLAGLTPTQRRDQARVLIKLPISTVLPKSYIGWIPSRQRVIRAAGKLHDLEPALVAAFLLAEQRDQSKLEDAKDFDAATSLMKGNTSIGLGQIVVSTARRDDLFADLLAAGTRKALSHSQIAFLLSSDEFNIFGVARYIRKTADKAATLSPAALPHTTSVYPSISFSGYARDSKHWPDDNIKAMGSEYTSKAWDDSLRPAWGSFVFEAYKDVKAAAVF